MSERKFKIGDVVKPVKTDPESHNFEEWEILTITRVSDGDPNLFECTRSDGNWDLLWGFELELVEGGTGRSEKRIAISGNVLLGKGTGTAIEINNTANYRDWETDRKSVV